MDLAEAPLDSQDELEPYPAFVGAWERCAPPREWRARVARALGGEG